MPTNCSQMDLSIAPENKEMFKISVCCMDDDVSIIKEKIRNHERIPASHELTLIFNGQVLSNDWDVAQCGLCQNSYVQLKVSAPAAAGNDDFTVEEYLGTTNANLDELMVEIFGGGGESFVASENAQSSNTITGKGGSSASKVRLLAQVSEVGHFAIEMMMSETVRHLKEKIHQRVTDISTDRMKLAINGIEMYEKRIIGDYSPSDDSKINVIITPEMPPPQARNPTQIKINLDFGKLKIDVNHNKNVQDLRNELETLGPQLNFQLPQDGKYFFTFNGSILQEEMSLHSQGVRDGADLKVLRGRVSG